MIVIQPKIIRGRVIPHRRNVALGVASLKDKEHWKKVAKEEGVKSMTEGNPLLALNAKRLLPDVFDRWERCLWSRIDVNVVRGTLPRLTVRFDVGKGFGANKMVGLTGASGRIHHALRWSLRPVD